MPVVTLDGRSLMIDGKRIWLVAGRIPFARLPREEWPARIAAAKLAGFNTIETPVFWNRIEPRPGKFDFTGENDLKQFVQLVGRAGMMCVLSAGPFVGSGWDMGGLPSWLLDVPGIDLRTANGPFLEACSRYITAVADQVKGLQATSPGGHGPLVLLELESGWTCGDDTLAASYIGELVRYVREAGLTVPIIGSANLWQSVEGVIDGWSGEERMLETMRQLAHVKPHQPRIVVDFGTGEAPAWGDAAATPFAPEAVLRSLAETLAAGGQFCVRSFTSGFNPGFWGGRKAETTAAFACADAGPGMVDAAGLPTALYEPVRRLATFASRFARVFSHLDPAHRPICLLPDEADATPQPVKGKPKATPAPGAVSIVHALGQQGSAAFVFGPAGRPQGAPHQTVTLLLPDGSELPVTLGAQSVAWCLFDTHIHGRATLHASSFSMLGVVGKVLVCFGPGGASGVVSINGAPIDLTVPSGRTPEVQEHEGLIIVLCNEDHTHEVQLTDDAVFIGAVSLDAAGAPIAAAGLKSVSRISAEGERKNITLAPAKPHADEAVPLSGWMSAGAEEYQNGTIARYAAIDGPKDLAQLGCPTGYGWYRATLISKAARRVKTAFPRAADRLHVFLDGKAVGVAGFGPGAEADLTLPLKKGEQTMVILAENLGRAAGGVAITDRKGLFGLPVEIEKLAIAKPKVVSADPVDPFTFRRTYWGVAQGDTTTSDRLTWTIPHRKKSEVIVHLPARPGQGLLFLNGKPFQHFDSSGPSTIILTDDMLARGTNLLQAAAIGDADHSDLYAALSAATFSSAAGPIGDDAEWAFAKWELPPGQMFQPSKGAKKDGPAWWRCTFTSPEAPLGLRFEATGLTKGQLLVNGRHVCRYFVADAAGKKVPPQEHYHIPRAWLKPKQPNEITLFDEHGASPTRCRLVSPRH